MYIGHLTGQVYRYWIIREQQAEVTIVYYTERQYRDGEILAAQEAEMPCVPDDTYRCQRINIGEPCPD